MRRMHAMFELFLVLSVSVVAGEPPTRRDELHKAPSLPGGGKPGDGGRPPRAGGPSAWKLEVLKRRRRRPTPPMASAMTLIVDVAGSYISLAGILTMTYYDAATGKVHFLNAGFNTPIEGEGPPLDPQDGSVHPGAGIPAAGPRLVPGFMAGVQAAHDRFGKLPFTRVIEPAIALAEDGFEVDPQLAGYLQYRKDVLSRLPRNPAGLHEAQRRHVLRAWRPVPPARELAATLRQVTAHGAAYLYTGDWAAMVRRRSFAAGGGLITLRDMESYRVTWEEPLETTYHDARIFAPGFSSVGGVDLHRGSEPARAWRSRRSALEHNLPAASSWLLQIANNQALSYDTEPITKRYPGRDLSPRARVTKDRCPVDLGRRFPGRPVAVRNRAERMTAALIHRESWPWTAGATSPP